MISNIPRNTWDGNGLTTPDEPEILSGVISDLQQAFSNNLYLDASDAGSMATPQGQIATSITQIKGEINDNLRFLSNQINPKYSSGIYQDALAWLYFLIRKPAIPTVVNVECAGLDGTVIPIGVKVRDASGNTYISTTTGTIVAGQVAIVFENEEKGAIQAPSNTLTKIQQTVVGWESCNNINAGVIGTNEETQQEFEARRYESVAKNAHGTLASIYAAVFEVDGVIDVYAIENVTGSSIFLDGFEVKEHSIYVCAKGGDDTEIASAIFAKKDVGADYNGNVVINIKDYNYSYPYPNYDVKFQRPTDMPIQFVIQVVNDTSLPDNSTELIKTAVIETFLGKDGGTRARIGSTIIANDFVANIVRKVAFIKVLDIDVSATGANVTGNNSQSVPIYMIPTIQEADIMVVYV